MKLPTISVIIATCNSERTIKECLQSLKNQKYPKKHIEIIIVDGGSTDKTVKIVQGRTLSGSDPYKKIKIVNVPPVKQKAEYNKGFGLKYAKNELVLFIDHDNILPHKHWLQNMVEPRLKHKDVVGVEPLRYHYDKNLNLLDRY